jgi:outer membrane protein OmpA-like peptidoglycan-associated protein
MKCEFLLLGLAAIFLAGCSGGITETTYPAPANSTASPTGGSTAASPADATGTTSTPSPAQPAPAGTADNSTAAPTALVAGNASASILTNPPSLTPTPGAQAALLSEPPISLNATDATGTPALNGAPTLDIAAPAIAAAGPADSTPPQGSTDASDAPNPWTFYRNYTFDYNDAHIQTSDVAQTAEIAAYLRDNPGQEVGLDGSMDPNGSDPKDPALIDRRVQAVRAALIQAGVPEDRIKIGAFGDLLTRKDRCVEVLLSTGN